MTCLADVREPCQLGCRNLSYCTNFNNRYERCTKYFVLNLLSLIEMYNCNIS